MSSEFVGGATLRRPAQNDDFSRFDVPEPVVKKFGLFFGGKNSKFQLKLRLIALFYYRYNALTCVATVARVVPKTFYNYWPLFIPAAPHHPQSYSIFAHLFHDPTPKVYFFRNYFFVDSYSNLNQNCGLRSVTCHAKFRRNFV